MKSNPIPGQPPANVNKGAAIRPLTGLFVMAVRREAPGGAADVTLSGLVLSEGASPLGTPAVKRRRSPP